MGSQKLLEVVRALMARPRLLLLDEPAAGLNDAETAELGSLLRAVRDSGTTVMVVEHNMSLVMGVADRVIVLDAGTLVAAGTPQEIRQNARVIEAYVGPKRGPKRGRGVMLELRGIAAGYGGLSVIHDIDLTVRAGEIVTLGRRQRRRQVDIGENDFRPAARARGTNPVRGPPHRHASLRARACCWVLRRCRKAARHSPA